MKETDFWLSVKDKYPLLSDKAQRIPIHFVMSYVYEAGFSAFAVKESKYLAKISVEQEIGVAVSSPIPRFEKYAVSNWRTHRISNCVFFFK